MKRILLLVLTCLAISVWGQQISEQQAKERVLQFLNDNAPAKARGLSARMEAAKVEAQSIYAFNVEGGGYIIASGDSRALPLLGYSDKGTIDWDHMPDNMRYWLKQYDQAMATLGKNKTFRDGNSIFAKATTRAERQAVAPLIKTEWYQGEPYWDKCPLYDGADYTQTGKPCPTGCVATAMAQVMNYWLWPKASPEIPAYEQYTAFQGKEKKWNHPALPAVTFDWANMIENYEKKNSKTGKWEVVGTDTQKEAVATLMQYCGQATLMQYTPQGSSSMGQTVAEALAKYFCYDAGVRNVPRIKYTIDEWENLLYGELSEGRPVLYGGMSDDSGHEFVCDGYDGKGLYHINWGWGGVNDGYFSLSVLNPEDNESIGSSPSSSIGYCIFQDMLVGMKPAPEGTSTVIPPAVYLSESYPFIYEEGSDTVTISLTLDAYGRQVTGDYGFGTLADDGTLTPLFTDKFDEYVGWLSNYYMPVVIDKNNAIFANGNTATLYPMAKLSGGEWEPMGSVLDCIFATVDNGSLMINIFTPEVSITDVKFTGGTGRAGLQSQLSFTVKNTDLYDFRDEFVMCPVYYGNIAPEEITDETPSEQGDWFYSGAYIRPGETADVPFSFKPTDTGTVKFHAFAGKGKYLGSITYKMNDVIGCYDEFVRNDSYLDVDYVYTRDYQQTSTTDGDDPRPGHYTWHVHFTDNNGAGHPYGRPSDKIYCYGGIRDLNRDVEESVKLTDKAIDYLTKLPTNGGNGNWTLDFDVELDIRLGGTYSTRAYFSEDNAKEDNKAIFSAWTGFEFDVIDDPAIHVVGDTILTSGQDVDLELEFNTGYPYDGSQFTGNEQGRWTLYSVGADGSLTEQKSAKWSLGFNGSRPSKAFASTCAIKEKLADGRYLIRASSDWAGISPRDISLVVGSTAINGTSIDTTTAKGPYTDLQGRRHDSRPTRKGVYINNGRKVIMK